MTREEFIKKYKNDCRYYFDGYYSDCIDDFLTKIYNDHEAQLKAKDEEIERLKADIECAKSMMNGLMQCAIITHNLANKKARSIVAMLFWKMKRQKAIYSKSFNELGINNHNTSFYKGAYENSKMRFQQAYKMLKDNA